MSIRIVGTDIDGVWTDGGMYYDNAGNEWKRFNTYDAAGVNLLKKFQIEFFVITGEKTKIVKRRMKKLNVKHVFQGIKNKYETVNKILQINSFLWNELAYIGDDVNDYEVLKRAGLSACPASAPLYIQEMVDSVVPLKGGDGVFRFFVEELILKKQLNLVFPDAYFQTSRI